MNSEAKEKAELDNLYKKISGVKINISKFPEIEKSKKVLLSVTSIEGITEFEDEAKFLQAIRNNTEAQEIMEKFIIEFLSNEDIVTMEDLLKIAYEQKLISEPTREAFWREMPDDLIMQFVYEYLKYNGSVNEQTGKIQYTIYSIINPVGEKNSIYYATKNGTYTFKVKDIFTGNIYEETVEVTNVDERGLDIPSGTGYNVDMYDYDIYLNEGETKESAGVHTTFDHAYVTYNDVTFSIDSMIQTKENYNYISDAYISEILVKKFKALQGVEHLVDIILVKDGVAYYGYGISVGKPR